MFTRHKSTEMICHGRDNVKMFIGLTTEYDRNTREGVADIGEELTYDSVS